MIPPTKPLRSQEEILHKMKSPITSITGYSSMLYKMIKTDDPKTSKQKLLSILGKLKESTQALIELMAELDENKKHQH